MIQSRAIRDYDPVLYCTIAAAVLGAGALSAGAGIWGANKAADAQTSAANAAIANQQGMFGKLQGVVQPFINAGQGGIPNLQDWLNPNGNNPLSSLISMLNPNGNNALSANNTMLSKLSGMVGGNPGLNSGVSDLFSRLSGSGSGGMMDTLSKLVTPGPDQNAALAQTPGYQFSVDQGTRAAQNALAARGLGGSPGAIAKGVGGYVAGAASQNYNQVVQNLINSLTSGAGVVNSGVGAINANTGQLNAGTGVLNAGTSLFGMTADELNKLFGTGSNALQNLVNTGTNATNTLAGVGTNTSNQISGSLTGAGNAQAAGANATGAAVGNLGNSVTTAALLQQLMGSGGGGGGVYGTAIPGATGPTSFGGSAGPAPLFG